MAPSIQVSWVWESFGLNSLKPSLAPPYPPTLIATPHCLYWEGCAFPGQTRPSVTGLLPSSSSEFGLYPSPALALQVGSLPITNLLQRSPEDSKSHNSSQNKTMHFPFWICGMGNPVHTLCGSNTANTDASVFIHFSQYVLAVQELQHWVLDVTILTLIPAGLPEGRIPFGSPDKSVAYTSWEAKHCVSRVIKYGSFLMCRAAGGDIYFLSQCIQTDPCTGLGMALGGHVQSCCWDSESWAGIAEHAV